MNVPPVSVERVQKCVVNFEIYRFLKKSGQFTPSSPTCCLVECVGSLPSAGCGRLCRFTAISWLWSSGGLRWMYVLFG